MKYSILSILILTLTLGFAIGGETYQASMTGCTECNSCKKKVVMSFAALSGVEGVRFLSKKKDDLYQVIIVTDGTQITADAAANVLKALPHYELKVWTKVEVPQT